MLTGWNYSKRIVADVEAAALFYAAMGLKIVSRRTGSAAEDEQVFQEQIYMSATGDVTSHLLILCRFPAYAPPKPAYPGEAWLCFNVSDVDLTCRTAVEAGGQVFRAGQDIAKEAVRAAIIADRDGHFIEIVGPLQTV